MSTYFQQAVSRIVIHRTQEEEEMEVASTVHPHEGELRASNEYFDQEWQRRFLIGGVQVKIRPEKLLLLNVLFAAFLFCFLWRNLC